MYTSKDSSQKSSSTESSSQDKIPSILCAYCKRLGQIILVLLGIQLETLPSYCKRQGHVISDCQVLKVTIGSNPVVAFTSAESSFK